MVAYGLSSAVLFYLEDSEAFETNEINYEYSSKLMANFKCQKRVVAYSAKFLSNHQLKKLTHFIFTSISIFPNGTIKWPNCENFESYARKAKMDNPNLKIMVEINGKFFSVLAEDEKKNSFIKSISSFVVDHKFDGVDIFWSWPEDEDTFHLFIKEFREKLEKHMIISIAIPRLAQQLEGFNLKLLMNHIDFLNVLSINYYEPLPGNGANIGPISPLYGGQRGNVDGTLKYLTCITKRPSILNMGVTFTGIFWNGVKDGLNEQDDIWKVAQNENGPGKSIGWRKFIKDRRNTIPQWHDSSKSSYAWDPKSKIFLAFENEKSLSEKVIYVRNKNIGGLVIWNVDQDDNDNSLLNALTSMDMCARGSGGTMKYRCSNSNLLMKRIQ
ncbi:GH18 domain-containing protein [Caenorhabditis elegans]|uniref:GH18 domain-containing protein n=1 Tax=Caenorhabditis elegans TaxID=6239 RepID=Q17841_CAEEL|nr:GH18 domain-containing protein [Caenorhabditis elegans]CAA91154.2 GH18 domain-containing protein [Caenorhabditis elegans]|eukprot:NP_496133.2 CHItinase-Like [Caenorhabditis elegans]